MHLFALDATTGKQKWVFDPSEGRKVIGSYRNRELATGRTGKETNVFRLNASISLCGECEDRKTDLKFR